MKTMTVRCIVNNRPLELETAPDRRVVDLLREDLGLLGTKEGCGSGECGACTVLVDNVPRLSCLMLAAQLEGRTVVTVEGLGTEETPHPVQRALVEHGAEQCGFCTPGMTRVAADLLAKKPCPERQTIREALSGNLCRCTGYQKIVDAVQAVARDQEQRDPKAKP